MENFIILEEIAQTQFSVILKAKNKKTREIVVLKSIVSKKVEEAPSKEILRELLVLQNFKHENVKNTLITIRLFNFTLCSLVD